MAATLTGKLYENFVEVIKSKETRITYDYRLRQYLTHRRFKSVKDMMTGTAATIQQDIIDYLKYLKNEKHLSYASRQLVTAALRKFYSQNDVVLNWDKIGNYLGENERTIEDRAYNIQEIKKLLDVAPLRGRVLILLLASSGLRRGAVPGVMRKHLKWIDQYGLYQITTYPKAKERYITFCTPEAAKEINAYFAYREQCGETLTDDTPLIREDFNTDDMAKVRNPQAASNVSLKMILVRAAKLAGVRTPHQAGENGRPTQRTEVMLTHGLRKWYDTNLVRAIPNAIIVSAMMGHKGGLQKSYFKITEEELLAHYLQAVNALTVNDENRLKLQVKKLQSEKDELIELLKARVGALERANENREILKRDMINQPVVRTHAKKLKA